jgi:putative transposase
VIDAAFSELEPLVGTKGACLAVGRARASHYRRGRPSRAGPRKPRPTPPNALSAAERAAVLDMLHGERFVDRAPAQAWATLLDEGSYLASPSTMYRLLRTDNEVRERRALASHPRRTVPELVAEGPNRVWSYDATALRGPARGVWYDLFVMLDIFSRYCPGWMVVAGQDAQVVRDWIERVVAGQGAIPGDRLFIHTDRGAAMTSKAVSQLLADLHIGQTHSRPHVSNDNPYSEAGFKTLVDVRVIP